MRSENAMKKRKINWWKLLAVLTSPIWFLPACAIAVIGLGGYFIFDICRSFYYFVTDEA